MLSIDLAVAPWIAASTCVSLGGNFCTQAVATTSGAQNVTVTAGAAGTVSTIQILTLGISGLDFATGAGANTCASAGLALSSTCIVSVTFTPVAPGVRRGAVVLLDSSNHMLGQAALYGTGLGGLGVLSPGNVLPVAGNGNFAGTIGDGDPALDAVLDQPASVALDGAGDLYIADRYHNRIRKVAAGTISTLAGNGVATYSGDGQLSTNSAVSLNAPGGVALDGAGNLFIADTANHVVREIVAATGRIQTFAGTGTAGFGGDNGPATAATLNAPQGVSVDAMGRVFIADTSNNRIRMVDATGTITTVAGNGTAGHTGDGTAATSAELNQPFAVAFDANGNYYIPDSANNVVRVVNAQGTISAFAGTGTAGYSGDRGVATLAELFAPMGVATDAAGNVYIADTENDAIRKVSAATGFIFTAATNGSTEFEMNDTGPFPLSIYGPTGLAIDGNGNVFFADSLNMRVREMQSNVSLLDFTANPIRQGDESAPLVQRLENDGNAPLTISGFNPLSNAALDHADTTCSTGSSLLTVNTRCSVSAIFAPTASGSPLFGQLDVITQSANSPLTIVLAGDAEPVDSTTTTLASTPNPSGFGSALTLTATVTTGAGTGNLTGTVSFYDSATLIAGPVQIGTSSTSGSTTTAQAIAITQRLAVGNHSLTATYDVSNDPSHSTSTSSALTQTVLEGTQTQLTSSKNPALNGQSVMLRAVVSPTVGSIAPDGAITFTDGLSTLCATAINTAGVATCTASALSIGVHSLLATYAGDAARSIAGSISNALLQDVQDAATVVLTSPANPAQFGAPLALKATITSNAIQTPTGTVTFLDGSKQIGTATVSASTGAAVFTIATLALGTHTLTASYAGDANSSSAVSSALAETIVPAQTTTTVSTTAHPAIAGGLTSLTASVRESGGGGAPGGNVTFTDRAGGVLTTLGTATIGSAGLASLNARLAPGSHTIVGAYSGDATDIASVSPAFVLNVVIATSSVLVTAAPDPSSIREPVTLTATVSGNGGVPTGDVTFLAEGNAIGTATLNGAGTAPLSYDALSLGTHSITAAYKGDLDDAAATSAPIHQVVNLISTTTTLTASTSSGANPQIVLQAVVASVSGPTPTGTITFSVGTNTLATIALDANGVATATPQLAVGDYSVIAAYSGDALHATSESRPISVAGAAAYFTVSVTPASLSLKTADSGMLTVKLTSNLSFSDTVGLGCGSLPSAVSCRFSNATVALAANGSQTVQLAVETGSPLSASSSATKPRGRSLDVGSSLAACFGTFFVALCARRRSAIRLIALLALFCVSLLSSCTSLKISGAQPGDYLIQVTATGVTSNLSYSQNVALTITQ